MSESDYVEMTPADLAYRWRERTVVESAQQATQQAMSLRDEDYEYASAEKALAWLLKLAWSDLALARSRAMNGMWSIECDGYVERIVGLTELAGPTRWERVAVGLIVDGTYEAIHAAAGYPTPLSEDDLRRAQRTLSGAWKRAR